MAVSSENKRVFFSSMDSFLEEGSKVCAQRSKEYVVDDDSIPEALRHRLSAFRCSCQLEFDNVRDFESHYALKHRNVCLECKEALPTSYLLELHLNESHNPIFDARSGPKFACFVEGCDHTSVSWTERKDHAVSLHGYPANYRFQPVEPRKLAVEPMQLATDPTPDGRPAAVPSRICFGRGSVVAWHRKNAPPKQRPTMDITMKEVQEALDAD